MKTKKNVKRALKRGSTKIDNFNNRYNKNKNWNHFFDQKKLVLADLSHPHFNDILEPISSTEKITASNRWYKKYHSFKQYLPEYYSIEDFVQDYYEVEKALKKYNLESLNLFENTFWMNTRGYEYLQMVKSGYKYGVINHACSDLKTKGDKFWIEVHPGRHSHWARRFLKQKDIHFLSVLKKDYKKFVSQYNPTILDEMHSISDILNALPNATKNPRIFLQGSNYNYWPFIVTELNLPKSDWGYLDKNNQINIDTSLKGKTKQYQPLLQKLLNGYDPRKDYNIVANGDVEYIQRLFFSFMLNKDTSDSIIQPASSVN